MPHAGRKSTKQPSVLPVPGGIHNVNPQAGGIQIGRPIKIIGPSGSERILAPSDGGMSTNPGIIPTIDERSIRAPARNQIDQGLAIAKARSVVAQTGGSMIDGGSEASGGNSATGFHPPRGSVGKGNPRTVSE